MDSISSNPSWLPELILLDDYNGNWQEYLAQIYSIFHRDFVQSKPNYKGLTINQKRHPEYDGKSATFWHLISEGSSEESRIPNFRRCERIGWPRPIIENYGDSCLKVWENSRKGKQNVCLWFEAEEYLLILSKRNDYFLLWTGYMVTQNHRKRKLEREYEEWKKANAAPK